MTHAPDGLDIALLIAAWAVWRYVVVHLGRVAVRRERERQHRERLTNV